MSVLVVVQSADEARPLVRWSARFARAKATRLIVLYPSRGTKDDEPAEIPLQDDEDDHEVRSAIRAGIAELAAMFPEEAGAAADATAEGAGAEPADAEKTEPEDAEPAAAVLVPPAGNDSSGKA